jgi:hypothetical protein
MKRDEEKMRMNEDRIEWINKIYLCQINPILDTVTWLVK